MYLSKKKLHLVKSVKSVTFCENHCSIMVKKPKKNTIYLSQKLLRFVKIVFFADALIWKSVWKLNFFPFLVKNN